MERFDLSSEELVMMSGPWYSPPPWVMKKPDGVVPAQRQIPENTREAVFHRRSYNHDRSEAGPSGVRVGRSGVRAGRSGVSGPIRSTGITGEYGVTGSIRTTERVDLSRVARCNNTTGRAEPWGVTQSNRYSGSCKFNDATGSSRATGRITGRHEPRIATKIQRHPNAPWFASDDWSPSQGRKNIFQLFWI